MCATLHPPNRQFLSVIQVFWDDSKSVAPVPQFPPNESVLERGVADNGESEDDEETGDESEEKEPEPEEDEDLLVDHVDGQQAECVVGLM